MNKSSFPDWTPWVIALMMAFVVYLGMGYQSERQRGDDWHMQTSRAILASSDAPAVEVDERGKVLYANEAAKELLPLLKVGGSVEAIMTEESRPRHDAKFHLAMRDREKNAGKTLSNVFCKVHSSKGLIDVHVQTWSTPVGAMAFITEVPAENTD